MKSLRGFELFLKTSLTGDLERGFTMKMNLKTIMMAGALALSFAGQASAAIINTANLGNNVILSIWDTTNLTSFTVNLGSTVQSFLTGAGVTFGGSAIAPAITGTDTSVNNFTYNSAALTSYLSTASANTVWSVVGGTNTGGAQGYGTSGLLTTVTSGTPVGTNLATAPMLQFNGAYVPAVSALMGAVNELSTTAAAGGAAYVGAAANNMGNNFGGTATFTNTASLGQSMNMFFLTPQAAGRAFPSSAVYQFADAAGASQWTLGANGLTYAVAAVPEPGEWLLMLSGLALIGFIATRRKDAGSMSFA